MAGHLRLILGDQLSHSIAALQDADKAADTILICEVSEEATVVRHHQKKIAFLFSAMRHFALELEEKGYQVRYVKLDDPDNTGSFDGEVRRAVVDLQPASLILTMPGEFRVLALFRSWQSDLGLPVEIREDKRFLSSPEAFAAWAAGKTQLRMEFFYREMRKSYDVLMEKDGKPAGGAWNFDKQNRKPPTAGLTSPKRISHEKSEIVKDVLQLVRRRFGNHFGTLEPFHYAVTRDQAVQELNSSSRRSSRISAITRMPWLPASPISTTP